MDLATSVASVDSVQCAFAILHAALHLTGSVWQSGATVKDKSVYDYIVIGAGTSGAVVARRLAENEDLKILLIEAGGDPRIESTVPGFINYVRNRNVIYNFTTENDGYSHQCHRENIFRLIFGKMLGGTTSINFMTYERGNEVDFDRWSEAAEDSSWKLSNLLKYYKKSEQLRDQNIKNSLYKDYHGYDGLIIVTKENRTEIDDFLNALEELGINNVPDLSAYSTVGATKLLYTIGNLVRQSTAQGYLSPPVDIPNLDILKHTEVQKILFDENKNAIGVTAMKKRQKVITLKAKREVILCAGVVNSPKILMLSGVGPKKHLESKNIPVLSDLPVGENYRDRPPVTVIYKLGRTYKPARPTDIHIFPYPVVLSYVPLNKSDSYPDYAVTSYLFTTDKLRDQIYRNCEYNQRFDNYICDYIYNEIKGRQVIYSYVKITQPKSRGRVLLRSNDPKDEPLIYTGFFSNDDDLDKAASSIKHFYMNLMKSNYFLEQNATFVDPIKDMCGMFKFGSRAYFRCYALCVMDGSWHAGGTCALGRVVDARLRVKGVNKLRVADASIMPNLPVSGTSATVIMIGEKAADMIMEDIL